jgi:hypothetical protein
MVGASTVTVYARWGFCGVLDGGRSQRCVPRRLCALEGHRSKDPKTRRRRINWASDNNCDLASTVYHPHPSHGFRPLHARMGAEAAGPSKRRYKSQTIRYSRPARLHERKGKLSLSLSLSPRLLTFSSQKSGSSKQSQAIKKGPSPEETDTLKVKKAWEVAIAPAKSLPMSAIGTCLQ